MKDYNKQIHHRKSIRLKDYDYSSAGLYFITICCQDMVCRYGHVENGEMILNEFGQIANDEWIKLSDRFENFELDVFQIMPNHMHGIIKLNAPVVSGFTPDQSSQNEPNAIESENIKHITIEKKTSNNNPSISDIIGAYKSIVSNGCLEIYKSRNQMMGKLWQRNFYEHIIRDEKGYKNISNYIVNNPQKWEEDKFYKS
jgi:REP element-mobilizing transposase RayT